MKKTLKVVVLLLLAASVLVMAASCAGNAAPSGDSALPPPSEDSASPSSESETPPSETSPSETPSAGAQDTEAPSANSAITADREGNPITLPAQIDTVISMGPSNTEVLIELGLADKIVAADEYSYDVAGLPAGIPMFSMMSPDGEQIISLNPDVLFATGMSKAAGDDPFKVVSDAGICVIYIPSSESIEAITEDIRFVSAVMGVEDKGNALIADMTAEIENFRQLGAQVSDKKSVYFEISAAPYMYSFGNGVFLNELLEIIGAENILAEQDSWISVTDEMILDKNPDVILTSVNYLDDPIGEIMSRPGWDALTAVENEDVYSIDANASNRPSHNIVIALREMAAAIYPDIF